MSLKLLIIDPQMDFMDTPHEPGALAVKGAQDDMNRLVELIKVQGSHLAEIYITMDSHHAMDIAHPGWWVNSKGEAPAPFTQISEKDVVAGVWQARDPRVQERSVAYLRELQASSRKTHTIWPEHCLMGTPGHRVYPELMEALLEWERSTMNRLVFVSKGENAFTEHFSGFKASVPDPADEGTQMNKALANTLMKEATEVLVAGEALSHCVADTMRDLVSYVGASKAATLTLLTDACSPVSGFEEDAKAFVEQMQVAGVKTRQTTDFLAKPKASAFK